jgi:hypothetical protein
MKGLVELIGRETDSIQVTDLEKFTLYSGLKLKKYINLGLSKQGKMKRLYLYKQTKTYSELLEGVDYNTLQTSVYKKITVKHEKSESES